MRKVIQVLSIILMIFFAAMILKDLWNRKTVRNGYEELARQVTLSNQIHEECEDSMEDSTVHQMPEWYQNYGREISFLALQKINSDIVGWIAFDKLEIQYPILAGETNETYLRVDYQGRKAAAGSIFIDSINDRELMDYHTILYGHNMRDGSMFGSLKKYKRKDFYDENPYFTIYTPEKIMRYQIFSCHETDAYGSIYTVGFGPSEEYENFIQQLVDVSNYDCGITVSREDRIVTLSTCTVNENDRFVVHAKLIDSIENQIEN